MVSDIKLALVGNLKKELEGQRKDVVSGVWEGTDDAAEFVKGRLRGQVTRSGLGDRLAKTWRHKTYPRKGTDTLEPAAVISSKAPKIIHAFSSGETIRSKTEGGFLVIATDFAPVSPTRKGRKKRMSMADFLDTFGMDSLRVFPKPGSRNRVFYAVADKGFRKGRGKRGGSRKIKDGGRAKAEPVLMYVLVKQVRLGQRFNIDLVVRAAEKA
ncbi:DUF6441 family protein, partial [Roseibium suaedae]